MSSHTITNETSVADGITAATAGGHTILYLDDSSGAAFTGGTVTGSSGRGPGTAVPRLTVRPLNGKGSVTVGDLVVDQRWAWLRFHGIVWANNLIVNGSRTLPIFDGAGTVCENAGIKVTSLCSDLPVPRVRVRNHSPKAANRVENLVVTVERRDITVSGVSTDANKRVTTTAASIIEAINNDNAAQALVFAEVEAGQDGSGHVQDGFPFFTVSSVGRSECEVEELAGAVSLVGCELGTVRLRPGAHDVNVKRCYYPESSFALTCSMNDGDRTVRDVRFDDNYCYGGYNTDCVGPRPAEFDGFYMRRNVFEGACDPEASSIHADTFQPVFGGRLAVIQRNKFIDQSGQCFFFTNFLFHKVLVENNLIHQNGEGNLICQIGGIKTGIFRHNTIIVSGWLWDDGDAADTSERLDGVRCYHNIATRFSRTTGVPVPHAHNIVEASGTGWNPDVTDTAVLPDFVSPDHPDWDYHYADSDQPGVGDGNTDPTFSGCHPVFMGMGEPTVDLDGTPRNPASVDLGCYVA